MFATALGFALLPTFSKNIEMSLILLALAMAGVYSAIAYYYDHRAEIDKKIADDDEYVREMKRISPSLLEPNRHILGELPTPQLG